MEKILPKQDTNIEGFYHITLLDDLLQSFEMFYNLMQNTDKYNNNLKWLILSLQCFVQSLLVHATKETALCYILENNTYLKSLEDLFTVLILQNKTVNFSDYKNDIKDLQTLRNNFVHFKTSGWSIEKNYVKNIILKSTEFAILVINNATIFDFVYEPNIKNDLLKKLNYIISLI